MDNRQSPLLAVLVISWSVATAIILHREVFGIEFGKAIISIITGPALSDGRPCVPVLYVMVRCSDDCWSATISYYYALRCVTPSPPILAVKNSSNKNNWSNSLLFSLS